MKQKSGNEKERADRHHAIEELIEIKPQKKDAATKK